MEEIIELDNLDMLPEEALIELTDNEGGEVGVE